MKSLELQPTPENIFQTFDENAIGRNLDVYYFVQLLNSLDHSCSISLDAQWGAGKTFFVHQTKMVLDAFNNHVIFPEAIDRDRVKRAWARVREKNNTELQPQVAVYYDAWLNDNDQDPVLSLVYTIMQSVSTYYDFKQGTDCLKLAGAIAEKFTQLPVNVIAEALKREDPLAELRKSKGIHQQVEEFLDSLLAERGNRLVIFIDELDRCKPTFAVQLLERIKHYFANDRITFVFSVNTSELQHTIKQYYGTNFNASRYLNRFFDLPIMLPPPKLDSFYDSVGLQNGQFVYEKVCKAVIETFQLQPREIIKFYGLAKIAAYKPTHSTSMLGFAGELATNFALMCVLPIMVGLKVTDQSKFDRFIHGEDSSPLIQVLSHGEIAQSMCRKFLDRDEIYSLSGPTDSRTVVSLEEKLAAAYHALFVHKYSPTSYVQEVGSFSFSSETKDLLLRAVSALSGFADYNL